MSEFNIGSSGEIKYKFEKGKYKTPKRKKEDDIYGIFNDDEEEGGGGRPLEPSDDDNDWNRKFVKRETKKVEEITGDNIKVVERDSEITREEDFRSDINNIEPESTLDKKDEKKLSKDLSKYGKGFRMLKNMGYKVGKGIGLKEDGITEPIAIEKRQRGKGLTTKEKDNDKPIDDEDEYLGKKRKPDIQPDGDKNFEEFEKLIATWKDIRKSITINPIDINKDLDLVNIIESRGLKVSDLDNIWDGEISMKIEAAKLIDDIDIRKLLSDKANTHDLHKVYKKIAKPKNTLIQSEADLKEVKEYLAENIRKVREKVSKSYTSLISNEDKTYSLYYEIFTLRKDKIATSQDINQERQFLKELKDIKESLNKPDFVTYSFIQKFITLHDHYPAQYNRYRKLTLFCVDVVKTWLKGRYRLEDYYKEKDSIIPIIIEVKQLIDKTTHDHIFEEDKNDHFHIFSHHHKVQESETMKKAEKIFSYFLSEIVIQDLINYIINMWNIKEYERLLKIFHIYEDILPRYLKNFIIDTAVIPKLKEEIVQWDPSTDKNPIHMWVHPWLEIVGYEKLAPIISIVQSKIETPILDWSIDDKSLIAILRPWRKWFPDWASFMNKYILPKLTAAIAKMTIRLDQTYEALKYLYWWNEFIHADIINILEQYLMPKWVNFLATWLENNPSAKDVFEWYAKWRKILEQHDFIKDGKITKYTYKALILIDNKFI
jgi:tuftelin-interacting protein 11